MKVPSRGESQENGKTEDVVRELMLTQDSDKEDDWVFPETDYKRKGKHKMRKAQRQKTNLLCLHSHNKMCISVEALIHQEMLT